MTQTTPAQAMVCELRAVLGKIPQGPYEAHHTRLSWWLETPHDKSCQLLSGVLPAHTWQQTTVELHDGPEWALARAVELLLNSAGPLLDLIESLSARAGVEGWLPIESAPKDGTPILIYQPYGKRKSYMPVGALKDGECSYKSDDERLLWFDDERWAIGYWRPWGSGSWGNRNSATVEPTHWQPLPAAPDTTLPSKPGGADREKIQNTTNLVHQYWLKAAKEALQGDLGKLRRHVAISESRTRDEVVAAMCSTLSEGDEA